MGKIRDFDNILDECLDRLMRGEDVNTVLALYPDYAGELAPLLKTALETRHAAAVKPRPEFRQRAAYEFQAAIRDMPAKPARNSFFKWQVRWMAPVAAVLVLLLAGGGTVAAAANSLPDSPLYRVKLATETVRLAFTRSDLSKAELYAQFADERVDEIISMAEKGKAGLVEQVTARMDSQLMAMADLTSRGEKIFMGIDSASLQSPAAMPLPDKATTPAIPSTTTTNTDNYSGITPPAITQPPTTVVMPNPTLITPEHGKTMWRDSIKGTGDGGELSEYQQMLVDTLQKIEENIQALREQLEIAPDALKPALEHAIEVLQQSYEEALWNLMVSG
ncbi:MAG: DUF5667 domain-containing protein [Dehalococcoidales bacterium]|jgi:hypothetical protein